VTKREKNDKEKEIIEMKNQKKRKRQQNHTIEHRMGTEKIKKERKGEGCKVPSKLIVVSVHHHVLALMEDALQGAMHDLVGGALSSEEGGVCIAVNSIAQKKCVGTKKRKRC